MFTKKAICDQFTSRPKPSMADLRFITLCEKLVSEIVNLYRKSLNSQLARRQLARPLIRLVEKDIDLELGELITEEILSFIYDSENAHLLDKAVFSESENASTAIKQQAIIRTFLHKMF